MNQSIKRRLSRVMAMTLCLILLISSAVPAGAVTPTISDDLAVTDSFPFQTFDLTEGEGSTWTVRYFNSNGDELESVQVEDGHLIVAPSNTPEDPTGASRTFIGWYQESDPDVSASPVDLRTLLVESDLDLYARFSATGGVVRFRDIFGNIIDGMTVSAVTVGAILTPPTEAQANVPGGSTISYWYVEGGDEAANYFAQNADTPVVGVVTLLPKVSGVYTVSFNTQGGTPLIASQVVAENGTVTKPLDGDNSPLTSKKGYTLQYWSLTPDGEAYDFDTPVTHSFTLYAMWGDAVDVGYTLLFYSSDYTSYKLAEDRTSWTQRGNFSVPAEDYAAVGTYLSSEKINELGLKYQSKAGNSFITEFVYYKGAQDEPLNAEGTTVIKLYYAPKTFTIQFDMGDYGYIEKGGVRYDSTNPYAFNANYNMGYIGLWPSDDELGSTNNQVVVGWKFSDGAEVSVASQVGNDMNSRVEQGGTLVIEAIWADLADTILLHYYRYGEVDYSTMTSILQDTSVVRAFSSLTFDDKSNVRYLVTGSIPTQYSYSTRVYAYSSSYDYTKRILKADIANSWYVVYNAASKAEATEVNRYYFYNGGTYSLTFNPGIGTFEEGTITTIQRKETYPILLEQDVVTVYTPPTPIAPEGYMFVGWYTNTELTTRLTASTTKSNSNQMVYAKYEVATFELVFKDGDNTVKTVKVNYGKSVSESGLAFPTGYTKGESAPGKGVFKGWYFYINGVLTEFTLNTPMTEDCVVFAQYESEQYTVTFRNPDDTDTIATYTVWSDPTGSGRNTLARGGGANRSLPTMPTVPGSVFGWFTEQGGNGTRFTATTPVNSNITVYGYYDQHVTIRYETRTGGMSLTRTSETVLAKNGAALGASVQEMAGYEFTGWYLNDVKVGDSLHIDPSRIDDKYVEGQTYVAKFVAVISYRSASTTMGTVSSPGEKVYPGESTNGSTAVENTNYSFVCWIDSHGTEVSDQPA